MNADSGTFAGKAADYTMADETANRIGSPIIYADR
jgi:hypothetical protein